MTFRLRITSLLTLLSLVVLFSLRSALTYALQTQAAIPPPLFPARFCVLYDFGERTADPIWQLQQGKIADGGDGYLYSTSTSGGTHGYGTVFKVSPTDGKPPVVLYNFDFTHGAGPQSGLTRGSDGNFYGTTNTGGKYGVGTIFSISSTGSLAVLWDFRNGAVIPPPVNRPPTEQEKLDAAGSYPVSAPVQLGNTWYGVAAYANNQQWGVVYQISGGAYKGLYQFKATDALANGNFPVELTVGPGGSLYGTTLKGALGWGTIYQVGGGGLTILHKFDAASSGSMGVIQAEDGSLYGTASGSNTSFGLIYKLNPLSQVYTVIHTFNGNDGSGPVSTLMQGKDGMLYGVTKYGGMASRGVIYRLNTDGSNYTVLFNLDLNDGRYAISPPIELSKGDFYGVTYQGGSHDAGVFYHLSVHPYPTPAHDSAYAGGTVAASDPMIAVTKNTAAYQADYQADSSGVWHIVSWHLMVDRGITLNDGVSVRFACLRDPHIVQFVYREKVGLDGKDLGGSYSTSWGTFELTYDPANPFWHTDAIGKPNAYYDQSPGSSHRVDVSSATIFDQPSLAADGVVFYDAAQETWRVTAKDFAICNGKVVRVANWTRETRWNVLTGKRGPLTYLNFSIEAPPSTDTNSNWSNTWMQWINNQLKKDGYDPIP